MKMKFGAIVVDGRGKIGGHVASKNRSGAYLRTKVTPVNKKSTAQTMVRGRLAGISQAWRGLSQSLIAAWNAAVSDYSKTDIFGDIKKPTGFTLFQKLNNNLAQCGIVLMNTPPMPIAVPYVLLPSVAMTGGVSVTLTFAPTPVPVGTNLIIRATKGMSAGISFVKSEFRTIANLPAATATGANFTAAYEAVLGPVPADGTKVFFEVYFISTVTGQKGAVTQCFAYNEP